MGSSLLGVYFGSAVLWKRSSSSFMDGSVAAHCSKKRHMGGFTGVDVQGAGGWISLVCSAHLSVC